MTDKRKGVQPAAPDYYGTLFEKCPDALFITSRYGKLLQVNEYASNLFGCPVDQLVGKNIRELCHEPFRWAEIRKTIDQAGYVRGIPLKLARQNGDEVDCLLSGAMLSTNRGRSHSYECVLWDISAYSERQERLRQNEERYRLLTNQETDGLWNSEWDDDMNVHITYITDSIASIIGYKAEELLTLGLRPIMVPSSLKVGMEALKDQISRENERGADPSRSWTVELEMIHKNGGSVWVEVRSSLLRDQNGKAVGTLGVTRDITERKRYEERLRSLSARLVELQEAERRRIARELHDQIGQWLTGLSLLLNMIPDLPAEAIRSNIAEAQVLINELMGRVKDMSLELRPSMLDDLGLMPTLIRHFLRYNAQTSVDVDFKQRGLDRRFPAELETAVFRIVQEGLTNVARHANVPKASVRVVVSRSRLSLQIEDNGKGFDPQVLAARGASSGITGMQERAALLGGHLAVDSIPGVGTRLMAEFPLEQQTESDKP
ncbi:MAG: PAS domain S-box protein [Chloroflexi bacterium]|nr:PAS domain S-box protein [Chloroflexota bacterium]